MFNFYQHEALKAKEIDELNKKINSPLSGENPFKTEISGSAGPKPQSQYAKNKRAQ